MQVKTKHLYTELYEYYLTMADNNIFSSLLVIHIMLFLNLAIVNFYSFSQECQNYFTNFSPMFMLGIYPTNRRPLISSKESPLYRSVN